MKLTAVLQWIMQEGLPKFDRLPVGVRLTLLLLAGSLPAASLLPIFNPDPPILPGRQVVTGFDDQSLAFIKRDSVVGVVHIKRWGTVTWKVAVYLENGRLSYLNYIDRPPLRLFSVK